MDLLCDLNKQLWYCVGIVGVGVTLAVSASDRSDDVVLIHEEIQLSAHIERTTHVHRAKKIVIEQKQRESAFVRNWRKDEDSYARAQYTRPEYLCNAYEASDKSIKSLDLLCEYFRVRCEPYEQLTLKAVECLMSAQRSLRKVMWTRADFASYVHEELPSAMRLDVFASLAHCQKKYAEGSNPQPSVVMDAHQAFLLLHDGLLPCAHNVHGAKIFTKKVCSRITSAIRSIWQLSDAIIAERRVVSSTLDYLGTLLECAPSPRERLCLLDAIAYFRTVKIELDKIDSMKLDLHERTREPRAYKDVPKALQAAPTDDACCKSRKCVIL